MILTINSFDSVSAGKGSHPLVDDLENKVSEHYLKHAGELRKNIESDLDSLEITEDKKGYVIQMIILSEFYYCNAEVLSEIFSPKENETKDTYGRRLASKQHTHTIKQMLSGYPTIKSLTLVKAPELKSMYGQEKVETALLNRFKMPFELIANAYTQCKCSEDTEALRNFFNAAFSEGCIAKRTTKLSVWTSKHLIF